MTGHYLNRPMTISNTRISLIKTGKKHFLPLLLLADEQESMIDRYLDKGDLYAMFGNDGDLIAVAVVTDGTDGVCELKNLAVAPEYQHQGYGRRMVDFLCNRYKDNYNIIQVGTGDSMITIGFYESCGFVVSHIVKDFFIINYDHAIIEDGHRLKDMVYLKKTIG